MDNISKSQSSTVNQLSFPKDELVIESNNKGVSSVKILLVTLGASALFAMACASIAFSIHTTYVVVGVTIGATLIAFSLATSFYLGRAIREALNPEINIVPDDQDQSNNANNNPTCNLNETKSEDEIKDNKSEDGIKDNKSEEITSSNENDNHVIHANNTNNDNKSKDNNKNNTIGKIGENKKPSTIKTFFKRVFNFFKKLNESKETPRPSEGISTF